MASNLESSIHRGSELIFDFSCFTCQENDRNTDAEFSCEECCKFYCGKCMEHHNYLFKKHEILGKENINKWPLPAGNALKKCQKHKKEKLMGFCEDHRELLCHVCHVYNHQQCIHVVLIADKGKDLHQKGEFNQLSATVNTLHGQLMQKKDDLEQSMQSLEKSYTNILQEIHDLRKAINDSLDQLEKKTIKELDTLLNKLRTSIQTDIENCTESVKKINCVQDDWLNVKDKSAAINFIMYRKCSDQSLKTEAVLKEMTEKNDMILTLNPDTTIQKNLSTLSGLGQILSQVNTVTRQNKPIACDTVSSQFDAGNQTSGSNKPDMVSNQVSTRRADIANQITAENKPGLASNPVSTSSRQSSTGKVIGDQNKPGLVSNSSHHQLVHGYQHKSISKSDPNQVIKMKSNDSKVYKVSVKNDSQTCMITGICETASGELLIADWPNMNVKLLDQTYKVVVHCDLPDRPVTMCSIDSSLVAVAVANGKVHFIRVTNSQLIQDRTLHLQHVCFSIAHHQGNLYITSRTALYQYNVDGTLLNKLYEDSSGDMLGGLRRMLIVGRTEKYTVTACAVSPDGDRIYVANKDSNQLVTLSQGRHSNLQTH